MNIKNNNYGNMDSTSCELEELRILLVEDDKVSATLIKKLVSGSRFSIVGICIYGEEVMDKVVELDPQLVLMDITLSGEMSGIDAAIELGKSIYNIPVVFLTADVDMNILNKAQRTSPYGFISKPFTKESLIFNINMAVYNFNRDVKLAKNEEILRRFFSSATDAIIILDSNLNILNANETFNKKMVFDDISITGKKITDIFYDIDKSIDINKFFNVIKTGTPLEDEITTRNNAGFQLYLNIKAFKVGNGIGMIIDDITREKYAEFHLQKSEAKYHDLLTYTNIGILIYDPDISISYRNPVAEEFFKTDIESDSFINKRLAERISRYYRSDGSRMELKEHPVMRVFATGEPISNYEIGILLNSGSLRWILVSGYPIFENEVNIEQVVITFIDVTEHRKANELIIKSEQLYSTVLNNISDMIFHINVNGIVTYINHAAKKHYKIETEDVSVLTVDFSFFWCGESIDNIQNALKKVMEMKYSLSVDCRCDEKIYELVIVPVIENNEIKSMISAARDITVYKKDRDNLKKALNSSIMTTVRIVEAKDPYTAGHQENVARIARVIAVEMGLPETIIETIWSAALVHDIGKIDIPSEILSKPGKLSDNEFALIKEHPDTAYRILKDEYPAPFPEIVRQHHERMDGSGYPLGLSGDDILLEARIITVADVIEAMASDRPYRAGLGINRALDEITTNMKKFYDPKVVNAAVNIFKQNKFKF